MISDAVGGKVLQETEVDDDDHPDECLEDQQELALLQEIRLAGLVDQLRDLEHGRVHRQALQLPVEQQPEHQTGDADPETEHQERAPVDAQELGLAEVGEDEARLPAGVRGGRWRGLRGGQHGGRGQGRERRGEDEADDERTSMRTDEGAGALGERQEHLNHVTSLSGQ